MAFLDWQLPAAAAALLALACGYTVAHVALRAGVIGLPGDRNRLGMIDGLRGYLALGVFIHHFVIWMFFLQGRPWVAPPSNLFNNLGQGGVAIFFMVTGALFYDKLTRGMPGAEWPALYVSRIFRLVPLYWFSVFLVVMIVMIRTGAPIAQVFNPPHALVSWLTFRGMPPLAGLQAAGQIVAYAPWSLTYEWQFYLSLPLLYALLCLAKQRNTARWIIPAAILAASLPFADKRASFVQAFAYGMLAVELARQPAIKENLRNASAAAIGVLCLGAELVAFEGSFGAPQLLLLAAFFVPVVSGNSYFGVLSRAPSIVLGEVSYSLYLLHGILLSVTMTGVLPATPWLHGSGAWFLMPLLAAVLTAVALCTFRLIEAPAISAGRRMASRMRRLMPNPAPSA